jgi:CBS domain-containing protein
MNELPEITRFLSELPGFEDLDHDQLTATARAIQIGYYKAGSQVLTLGAMNRQLHIVRSGALELRNAEGDLVMRPAEGDVFGFPSLMNAAPLRNQSVAIEDSLIYHLDGDVFAELRRNNDRFDTYFIRLLSDRLLSRPAPTKLHGAEGRAVSQLITRPPVTIDAAATIQEAARKMVDERVSAILVMDEGRFCGITTDRDFRQRVVARGLPVDTSIRDIMSGNPISIDAGDLAYEAALTMMQNKIHHLPVTENGELHCRRLQAPAGADCEPDQRGRRRRTAGQVHHDDYRLGHATALPYRRIGARLAPLYLRLGGLGLAGPPRAVGAQRPGQCARARRFRDRGGR